VAAKREKIHHFFGRCCGIKVSESKFEVKIRDFFLFYSSFLSRSCEDSQLCKGVLIGTTRSKREKENIKRKKKKKKPQRKGVQVK
jgi:hypothetical protein